MPFGGGGPLHAAAIAGELGISTICVPPNPGVISAFGLLASDFVKYASRTQKMPIEAGPQAGAAICRELRGELEREFRAMGLAPERLEFTYVAEMRFVGQAFELGVELDPGRLDSLTAEELRDGFEQAHHRMFFHGIGGSRPVEIVSFRVGATYPVEEIPQMNGAGTAETEAADRPIFDGGRWIDYGHIPDGALTPGMAIDRPTVIEGATATTLVPSGWRAELEASGNLVMRRSKA